MGTGVGTVVSSVFQLRRFARLGFGMSSSDNFWQCVKVLHVPELSKMFNIEQIFPLSDPGTNSKDDLVSDT